MLTQRRYVSDRLRIDTLEEEELLDKRVGAMLHFQIENLNRLKAFMEDPLLW